MVDEPLERERRAWSLLRWSTPVEIAEFDEDLAVEGFYTRVQRERSDKALDAFDKGIFRPLSELDAFRELEKRKVYGESDLYSPDKADRRPRYAKGTNQRQIGEPRQTVPTDTSYLDELKELNRGLHTGLSKGSTKASDTRHTSGTERAGGYVASSHEEQVIRVNRSRRPKRRGLSQIPIDGTEGSSGSQS